MRQAANGATRAASGTSLVLAHVLALAALAAVATIVVGPGARSAHGTGLDRVIENAPPVIEPLTGLLEPTNLEPAEELVVDDRVVGRTDPAEVVTDTTATVLTAATSPLASLPDPCTTEPSAPACDAAPSPAAVALVEVAGAAAAAAAPGLAPTVGSTGPPAAEVAPVRRAILPAALTRGSAFVGGWTGLLTGVAIGFGGCAALLWLRRRVGTGAP